MQAHFARVEQMIHKFQKVDMTEKQHLIQEQSFCNCQKHMHEGTPSRSGTRG